MSRLCPNGHTLSINVVLPPGAGRDYCPTCGWTDAPDPRAAQEMTKLRDKATTNTDDDTDTSR